MLFSASGSTCFLLLPPTCMLHGNMLFNMVAVCDIYCAFAICTVYYKFVLQSLLSSPFLLLFWSSSGGWMWYAGLSDLLSRLSDLLSRLLLHCPLTEPVSMIHHKHIWALSDIFKSLKDPKSHSTTPEKKLLGTIMCINKNLSFSISKLLVWHQKINITLLRRKFGLIFASWLW